MEGAARSKVGQLVVAKRKERDYAILDDIASQASRLATPPPGKTAAGLGFLVSRPAETSANLRSARGSHHLGARVA